MSRAPGDTIEFSQHAATPRTFVAIGVPTFGMVHVRFMGALYNLRHPLNRIIRQVYCIGKEVGDARNEIAAKALEDADPRCSHILFLDDDLVFHPDLLLRLLEHRKPIVSGLYYTKSTVPTPLVLHDQYAGVATTWRPGDLVSCHGHGMGLCLIDADLLRRIRDERDLGVDAFGYPAWFKTTKDQLVTSPSGVPAQQSQTEDLYFLEHVRACGVQPVVDTGAATFAWHFDTKTQRAYPERQWIEWQTKGTVTWPDTPDGPVVWEQVA